jgi:hypothetical protein
MQPAKTRSTFVRKARQVPQPTAARSQSTEPRIALMSWITAKESLRGTVVRRLAFISICFMISTQAFEKKHTIAVLIGLAFCPVGFYEFGYKPEFRRGNMLRFLVFFICPMAITIGLLGWRLFA